MSHHFVERFGTVGSALLGLAALVFLIGLPLTPQTYVFLAGGAIVLAVLLVVCLVSACMLSSKISRNRGED